MCLSLQYQKRRDTSQTEARKELGEVLTNCGFGQSVGLRWRDPRGGKVMTERRRFTAQQRQDVYDKLDGHCAYCGELLRIEDMQIDHVVPLRSGGTNDMVNLLPACRSCNHYKRGNSLEAWRRMLEATPATLSRDSYTYCQAVRFGLVKPTPKPVVFYFENLDDDTEGMG